MVRILTDEHLESFQCSKCRKYLSVFPVKNHGTQVICGRCSRDNDNDGIESPLYGLIAKDFLFKCVNRYEGCKELLRVDETLEHERSCVGRSFNCPKCKDDIERSILELIWHYKLKHSSSYLKRGSFEGKPPVEDAMLYVRDDVVFFVLIRHEPVLNTLSLKAVTLTGVEARQAFIVSNDLFCTHTKKKSCGSINAPDEDYFRIELGSVRSVKVVFNLEVATSEALFDFSRSGAAIATSNDQMCKIESPSVFEKIYGCKLNKRGTALLNVNSEELIDLTCWNCEEIIGLPIFQCTNNADHYLCHSCRKYCPCCYKPSTIKSSGLLFDISLHLRFPCKYKCGGYFNADLRIHERECEFRCMKCPECPSNIHLKSMENHLLLFHKKYFCEEYDKETFRSLCSKYKNGKLYFLLNDKWCFLKWYPHKSNTSNCFSVKYHFGTVTDGSNTELNFIDYFGALKTSINENLSFDDIGTYTPYMKFCHVIS